MSTLKPIISPGQARSPAGPVQGFFAAAETGAGSINVSVYRGLLIQIQAVGADGWYWFAPSNTSTRQTADALGPAIAGNPVGRRLKDGVVYPVTVPVFSDIQSGALSGDGKSTYLHYDFTGGTADLSVTEG